MSKLGIKVVISYIAIVLISTIVFLIMITNSISNVFTYEDKEKVENTKNEISSTINRIIDKTDIQCSEPVGFYVDKDFSKYYDFFIDGQKVKVPATAISPFLAECEIAVTDKNGNIKYIFSNKDYTAKDEEKYTYYRESYQAVQKRYKKINEEVFQNNRSYFIETGKLICKNIEIGNVIVAKQRRNFSSISKIIYSSIFSGFLITMLVSLVMALIFEMNIVGPISKLRKNISNISLDKEIKWKKIKTKDELEDINRELYIMTQKLQAANRSQKEFFQNTSHEFKTPLMSIQGYAEAIKDGVLTDDEVKDGLDIIIDESAKLADVITSVIYLSSIDKEIKDSSKETQMVNIYEEIELLKEKLEHIRTEKTLRIINNVPLGLSVEIEREKVIKVLSNLFSNAIRYAVSRVEFNFYDDNGIMHFIVSDDGKGFEEGEEKKIFERFYKGQDGNSGLGLAIAYTIVKSYKADMYAYNKPEGGAVIEIVVPKNDNIYY